MGALEDYINRVEKESGKWVAYWQLCTLESDYRRKYGRYPSKSELREYGTRRMDMPQMWKGKRTLDNAMFL